MASFEELRAKMQKSMINASAKVLVGKNPPTKYQDIPALFEGWEGTGSKAVRGALWIAKEHELIPPDTPLRQVWYMFIKLIFQKLKKKILNPVDSYTKSFADIMKATDYWYRDFNVVNPPSSFKEVDNYWRAELFPNVMLALEKESYFQSMDTFADLLGVNLYASGGQSSFSNAEDISRVLHEAHPNKDVNIYTISDYDPAGFNIGKALQSHFTSYLQRTNQNVKAIKVSPFPKDYTPTELDLAKFMVSPETVKQENWNKPERIAEREAVDLIDHRFEDIDFYNEESEKKGSELRDALYEGFLRPEAHKKWIQDWREKVKNGQFPHMLGLEVESLPREPFDKQMPNGMDKTEAIGNARMRLLVYDKLLKDFKLKQALRSIYDKYFLTQEDQDYPVPHAWKVFKRKADIHKLEKIKDEIDEKLDEIIESQSDVLENNYNELEEQLKEWIDALKEDGDIINKFEQSLRRAVALDNKQEDLIKKMDHSDIIKEINDYDLDIDTVEALEKVSDKNINFFNNVLQKIKDEIKDDLDET